MLGVDVCVSESTLLLHVDDSGGDCGPEIEVGSASGSPLDSEMRAER